MVARVSLDCGKKDANGSWVASGAPEHAYVVRADAVVGTRQSVSSTGVHQYTVVTQSGAANVNVFNTPDQIWALVDAALAPQ